MKADTTFIDAEALDRDASGIAPIIREGLSQMGGPSERTLRAIHAEAVRRAAFGRRLGLPFLRLAAAASFIVLVGAAFQAHLARQAGAQALTLQVVLHIGAPHVTTSGPVTETNELAKHLLSIQGLDEDSYFTPEETQVLSL